MNKNDTVVALSGRAQFTDTLTELLRTGASQLIEQAVETELAEFMRQYADQLLDNGQAVVVRNGYQPAREIQTGIGPVKVKFPKVRAKNSEAVIFRSALEEIYPETRHQRCWLHKTLNILNAVPKSIQPKVKQALHEM